MNIAMLDLYNVSEEEAMYNEITAKSVAPDHWRMTFTQCGDVFDEYFTADVFDLAREMVAPVA